MSIGDKDQCATGYAIDKGAYGSIFVARLLDNFGPSRTIGIKQLRRNATSHVIVEPHEVMVVIAALQAIAIDVGVLDEASLTDEQIAAVAAVRNGDSVAVPIEQAGSES